MSLRAPATERERLSLLREVEAMIRTLEKYRLYLQRYRVRRPDWTRPGSGDAGEDFRNALKGRLSM